MVPSSLTVGLTPELRPSCFWTKRAVCWNGIERISRLEPGVMSCAGIKTLVKYIFEARQSASTARTPTQRKRGMAPEGAAPVCLAARRATCTSHTQNAAAITHAARGNTRPPLRRNVEPMAPRASRSQSWRAKSTGAFSPARSTLASRRGKPHATSLTVCTSSTKNASAKSTSLVSNAA